MSDTLKATTSTFEATQNKPEEVDKMQGHLVQARVFSSYETLFAYQANSERLQELSQSKDELSSERSRIAVADLNSRLAQILNTYLSHAVFTDRQAEAAKQNDDQLQKWFIDELEKCGVSIGRRNKLIKYLQRKTKAALYVYRELVGEDGTKLLRSFYEQGQSLARHTNIMYMGLEGKISIEQAAALKRIGKQIGIIITSTREKIREADMSSEDAAEQVLAMLKKAGMDISDGMKCLDVYNRAQDIADSYFHKSTERELLTSIAAEAIQSSDTALTEVLRTTQFFSPEEALDDSEKEIRNSLPLLEQITLAIDIFIAIMLERALTADFQKFLTELQQSARKFSKTQVAYDISHYLGTPDKEISPSSIIELINTIATQTLQRRQTQLWYLRSPLAKGVTQAMLSCMDYGLGILSAANVPIDGKLSFPASVEIDLLLSLALDNPEVIDGNDLKEKVMKHLVLSKPNTGKIVEDIVAFIIESENSVEEEFLGELEIRYPYLYQQVIAVLSEKQRLTTSDEKQPGVEKPVPKATYFHAMPSGGTYNIKTGTRAERIRKYQEELLAKQSENNNSTNKIDSGEVPTHKPALNNYEDPKITRLKNKRFAIFDENGCITTILTGHQLTDNTELIPAGLDAKSASVLQQYILHRLHGKPITSQNTKQISVFQYRVNNRRLLVATLSDEPDYRFIFYISDGHNAPSDWRKNPKQIKEAFRKYISRNGFES